MGADIHSFVEIFNGHKWVKYAGAFTPIDEYDVNTQPFGHRDYQLFGFLAGVRDPDIVTIAEPRGLPVDVTPEVAKEYESYAPFGGAHSASWLTVAELVNYSYDQKTACRYSSTRDPLWLALPSWYFERLSELVVLADQYANRAHVRVVFWFDS